jgi:hypothetical protein
VEARRAQGPRDVTEATGASTPAATFAVLTAGLRALHGDDAWLAGWTAQTITTHGQRGAVRYEILARVDEAPRLHRYRWVGKVYDRLEDGTRVAATLAALAAVRAGVRDGLHLPRLITYDAPHHVLLQSHESGASLVTALAQHAGTVVRALGRALAALHAAPVTLDSLTTPADLLADAGRRVDDLCLHVPDHAADLRRLLADLEGRVPVAGPATPMFLHGDLGPTHLLWRTGTIVVLDVDRSTNGDAALDLGHLLTQLQRLSARRPNELPAFAALRHDLLAAYQERAPHDAHLVRRVTWYQQVVLVRKIHALLSHTARHRDADATRARRAEAIMLLERARLT